MKKLFSMLMVAVLAIAVSACASQGEKAVDAYCDALDKASELIEKAPNAEAAMDALNNEQDIEDVKNLVKENADYELTDKDKEKIKTANMRMMKAMNKFIHLPEEMIETEMNNQIESAGTIILSRTQRLSQEKLEAAVALLREKNPNAAILTTPWDQLDGMTILSAIEKVSLADELLAHMRAEHEADEAEHEHEHHHHHHDEDEHDHDNCCHHHDHDDDDDDDDHDHEHCCHHHHDEDEHDHDHHHHHHDGEECDDPHCGCHHHHHHADEVFTSWGTETVKAYSEAELEHILTALDSGEYGAILRAKGIVAAADGGQWLHYDFVPEEHQVRRGPADYTGRICVIGSQLKEDKLSQLFGL